MTDEAEKSCVRKLKAAMMQSYTSNPSDAGVTIRDMIMNYNDCYGPLADVTSFGKGYRTVDDLMGNHPDIFIKSYLGYTPNLTSLSAVERTNLQNMIDANKGKRNGSRGGGGSASRGRGGSFTGAGRGRGQARGDSLSSFTNNNRGRGAFSNNNRTFNSGQNFGNTSSFNSGNSFQGDRNTFGPGSTFGQESGSTFGSGTYKYDRNETRESFSGASFRNNDWNNGQNENAQNWGKNDSYNVQENRGYGQTDWNQEPDQNRGSFQNQYRDEDRNQGHNDWDQHDDRDRFQNNQRDEDNRLGLGNFGYNESRNDQWPHDRYQEENREPQMSSTPKPFEHDSRSAFSRPDTSTPPGLVRPGLRLTPPPGYKQPQQETNRFIPPSGFDFPQNQPSVFEQTQTVFEAPIEPSTVPNAREVTLAVLNELRSRWPNTVEESELVNLLKGKERFEIIVRGTREARDRHQTTLVKKLKKSEFKPYYHLLETQQGKEYLFLAGHPTGQSQTDLEDNTRDMVANYLFVNNTTEIERLAFMLGIEEQDGLTAVEWLAKTLEAANLRDPVLHFGQERGPNMTVSVIRVSSYLNYVPILPTALMTDEQKAAALAQSEEVQEIERLSPIDTEDLLQMTRKMFTEAAENGKRVFEPDYKPLSTVVTEGRDYPTGVFQAIITDALDLQTFWIMTEEDDQVYQRLKKEMLDLYETQDYPVYSPKVGEVVAFYKPKGKEGYEYLRGVVLEKNRRQLRLFAIDEGCHHDAWSEEIYKLPDYFSELPYLVARCSVGNFEVATDPDTRQDFEKAEKEECEHMLNTIGNIRIRHAAHDHLIVDVVFTYNGVTYNLPEDHTRKNQIVLI